MGGSRRGVCARGAARARRGGRVRGAPRLHQLVGMRTERAEPLRAALLEHGGQVHPGMRGRPRPAIASAPALVAIAAAAAAATTSAAAASTSIAVLLTVAALGAAATASCSFDAPGAAERARRRVAAHRVLHQNARTLGARVPAGGKGRVLDFGAPQAGHWHHSKPPRLIWRSGLCRSGLGLGWSREADGALPPDRCGRPFQRASVQEDRPRHLRTRALAAHRVRARELPHRRGRRHASALQVASAASFWFEAAAADRRAVAVAGAVAVQPEAREQ